MSEPIKAGDLVMVVKTIGCCNATPRNLGRIFRVTELTSAGTRCVACGTKHDGPSAKTGDYVEGGRWEGMSLRRLKRIPPLSELESEKNKQELTA